jgi:hypothetical protein
MDEKDKHSLSWLQLNKLLTTAKIDKRVSKDKKGNRNRRLRSLSEVT